MMTTIRIRRRIEKLNRVHIPVVRSGPCGGWIAAMNLKRKDLQNPHKNLTKMQIMNSTRLFI